jgi:hypothetical protein
MSQVPSNSLSVYKNKPFTRFAKKARITDADLWNAALQANEGILDANLGGGVIKQRIARTGEGKSGGSRTIILFRKDDRAVYVFGFEKKDMANISAKDLMAFREFAAIYLGYTAAEMDGLVRNGTLYQIQRPEGEMR